MKQIQETRAAADPQLTEIYAMTAASRGDAVAHFGIPVEDEDEDEDE